jgi:hypothetical protein
LTPWWEVIDAWNLVRPRQPVLEDHAVGNPDVTIAIVPRGNHRMLVRAPQTSSPVTWTCWRTGPRAESRNRSG